MNALVLIDVILAALTRATTLIDIHNRMKAEGRSDFNQEDLDYLRGVATQAIADLKATPVGGPAVTSPSLPPPPVTLPPVEPPAPPEEPVAEPSKT